jgi:signal transduction histidine kinase
LERHGVTDSSKLRGQIGKQVRSLSYLLHPPLLDEMGLLSAVHWFIEGIVKRTGLQIKTELPAKLPRLPTEMETTIFRILQESLTNVYRHSGSAVAEVEIASKPTKICVKIRDRGKGATAEVLSKFDTIGVGISGMRERARQFGGELKIYSADPGMVVELELPMPQTKKRKRRQRT